MSSMKRIWPLLIISLLAIIYTEALPRKIVCVIGAGRAGLGAIKKVVDKIDKFQPIAFERNSDVGGLWNYRDDPYKDEHGMEAHSGIYKNLRTVTNKNVMTYPDYPTIISKDGSTFISHDTFLEYMKNYTDHFQLRRYIQFDTYVTNVTPIKDKCNQGLTRWLVKKRNLNMNNDEELVCDAVIVCNGRYSKPNIPKIPGIEKFSGRVLHSRSYRKPEDFTNQTVVLSGAGLSGIGLTRDLSNHAKTVYLSHKRDYITDDRGFTGDVYIVKEVTAAEGNQLILRDNSRIPADAFIYCTGYLYDFPFLDESSGIVLDRHRLFPLYKNFINKNNPSMAFIGLGVTNIYGPHFYLQTAEFLEMLENRSN